MTTWERFPAKCSGMPNELPEDKWLTLRPNIRIKNKGYNGMKKGSFSYLYGTSFHLKFSFIEFISFQSISFIHSFHFLSFKHLLGSIVCSITIFRPLGYIWEQNK